MYTKSDLLELENLIKKCAQFYYEGNPFISDQNFDILLSELKNIDPENTLLKTVSFGYTPNKNTNLCKYKHWFECTSLDKYTENNIRNAFPLSTSVVVTPKLDGGSARAYYKDGKLSRVVSRGDGITGLDITSNMLYGCTIPLTVPIKEAFSVRGEIIISYDSFKEIKGSHPRNSAVGLSQSKYSKREELSHLEFIVYTLERPDINSTKQSDLEFLSELKFKTVPFNFYKNYQDFLVNLSSFSLTNSLISKINNIEYPIDGLVISDNLTKKSSAFKFKAKSEITTVKDIIWTCSRTGRYIPVLSVEPVELSGAIISNVTANNLSYLEDLQAGIDSVITIVRSNEIIPLITEVILPAKITYPVICYKCGEKLTVGKTDLTCDNEQCPSKTNQVIKSILQKFALHGTGGTSIGKVIKRYNLDNVIDVINLMSNLPLKEDLVKLLGNVQSGLILDLFSRIKNDKVYIDFIIETANIKGAGGTCAINFRDNVSVQEFISSIRNKKIPESWSILFPTYIPEQEFPKHFDVLNNLLDLFEKNLIDYTKKESEVKIKVCITGTLSETRSIIEKNLENKGVKIVDINNANILLCNTTHASSKYIKAIKRKIPIMTENEFNLFLETMM